MRWRCSHCLRRYRVHVSVVSFSSQKKKAMLDKRSRCDVLCDQVCLNGTHMALRFWFADIYNVPTVTAALHSSRRYLIVAY